MVDAFAADLAEAVGYAKARQECGEQAFTGAIYGGVAGGLTDEAEELIVLVMDDMLDTEQGLPPAGA